MSDTVKLIIEIPEEEYKRMTEESIYSTHVMICAIQNGIPLDDVKTEIEKLNPVDYGSMFSYESHNGARDMKRDILDIIDDIGKVESEE